MDPLISNETGFIFRVILSISLFYVWVIRYKNIVEEFEAYRLPGWLRDLVGILKLSCAFLLLQSNPVYIKTSIAGIFILMLSALTIHIKVKNKIKQMIPALSLLFITLLLMTRF